MRILSGLILLAAFSGCGSQEEPPNPLEKAEVPLPVVTMPMGHYPERKENSSPIMLKEKIPAGAEFACEGTFEVADPEAFKPDKMLINFVVEMNGQRVIAGSHFGGIPIPHEGNQYRYRSAAEVPARSGRYLVEVFQLHPERHLITSARIQVVKKAD